MTQRQAIKAHLAAHEAKIQKRRKSRVSADNQKKLRGLHAAVARMFNDRA